MFVTPDTSNVDMFVTASTELWNMLFIVVTPLVLKCSLPPCLCEYANVLVILFNGLPNQCRSIKKSCVFANVAGSSCRFGMYQ